MMGAATLNEKIMNIRIGDDEEKPQRGDTRCKHVVMEIDMP